MAGRTETQETAPKGAGSGRIELTAREIADLAAFAGLNVTQPPEEDADALFTVSECPPDGVKNYGEPSDPATVSHYQFIAWCTDYPEEGCVGLGPEIEPAALATGGHR